MAMGHKARHTKCVCFTKRYIKCWQRYKRYVRTCFTLRYLFKMFVTDECKIYGKSWTSLFRFFFIVLPTTQVIWGLSIDFSAPTVGHFSYFWKVLRDFRLRYVEVASKWLSVFKMWWAFFCETGPVRSCHLAVGQL